ncbi:MAG TPA: glycoside hydrolase family 2 protein [Acidisarcina sp.]|nr:glycoside hydrolase family 2 protein [Acidisarcina sp.]
MNLPAQETQQSVSLDSGWEFREIPTAAPAPGDMPSEWRPAKVPGDVHLDLIANKLIPDPFYRDNEAKLQWIENADWEYRKTLQVTPEMLRHQHLDMVFDGLDAYAEIYINDKLALTADNMFLGWRIDARPLLKAGDNQLRIVFPSPIRAAEKIAVKDPWRSRTKVEAKTYIRKAAYEYGWDWGPRFVTSGIWRPARMEMWDKARIADLYIHQKDVSASVAHLSIEAEVIASGDGGATLAVDYGTGEKRATVSRNVVLAKGVNHVILPLDINQPERWFPIGYGAQPIYKFNARLSIGKKLEAERQARAGLRSIVLRRDLDQWGRSFEINVNGIPIFAKGADVIPFDSFPSRVTTAQYRQVLESARDANMNMIRHWGGGYYETDEFYDMCDELGLMIWQDFMFGNDWQPGTYAFKQGVEKEAEYQVTRLRNHPSIVLWSGNNETEAAMSWNGRQSLPADVKLQMWQDYLTIFSGILDRTVNRLNPETPYWPSSPSADYEELSENFQSGDMHDWSVWHGRVPFTEYEKHFPRFMTEFGFQSFPEQRTVDAFTLPEDRTSIFTPVMLSHQKNNAGNSIIRDYMQRYYGTPKDFNNFLYASQVLQAEAMRIGAEHLRRTRPRAMGAIYWQLNDCWPVASWASLDSYGRWKALQYYAKRFYSPLLVSPHVENGVLAVYVVSDKMTPTNAQLRLRLMNLDGTVIRDEQQTVEIPALSSKSYMVWPLTEFVSKDGTDSAQIYGAAELLVGGQRVSSNIVYLAPPKLVHLPVAAIEATLAQSGDAYTLRLASKALARSVYASFGNHDVKMSDNYIDLLPGEAQEIRITSKALLEDLRSSLKVISLVDAIGPTAEAVEPSVAH